MSFFAEIHDKATRSKLRFLVIGGLAVNYYGYSRETNDIDLFISCDDRDAWMQVLAEMGYTDFADGGSFIQYDAPADNAWPVDLMLVQEQTFGPILEASAEAEFYGTKTKVPSLEHLLALKLHALKNTRTRRFLKDFLDVENLICINHFDIKSEKLRSLFDNTAQRNFMKKYPEQLPQADQLHDMPLSLPIASNLDTRPRRVELQAMLRRIEENMPWRNRRAGEAERRLAEKIPVEFVL